MLSVGFIHHYALGDNVVCSNALYMLRFAYNARVVIFGNSIMQSLFYDYEVNDIGELRSEHLELINSYNFNYIILTNPRSRYVKILESSNAKLIITATKFYSLFSSRCKTIPLYMLPKYRRMNFSDFMLELVRAIDKKKFDSAFKKARFPKIKPKEENREFIAKVLDSTLSTLESKIQDFKYMIMINPFSNAATHTLDEKHWRELIARVANFKDCLILLVLPPNIKWGGVEHKNSIVIQNNADLLNLVAILEHVSLLISPSTGVIHLASNMQIPSIGIYSKKDTIRWATLNKVYVILDKPKDRISNVEQNLALDKICEILDEMIVRGELEDRNTKAH